MRLPSWSASDADYPRLLCFVLPDSGAAGGSLPSFGDAHDALTLRGVPCLYLTTSALSCEATEAWRSMPQVATMAAAPAAAATCMSLGQRGRARWTAAIQHPESLPFMADRLPPESLLTVRCGRRERRQAPLQVSLGLAEIMLPTGETSSEECGALQMLDRRRCPTSLMAGRGSLLFQDMSTPAGTCQHQPGRQNMSQGIWR